MTIRRIFDAQKKNGAASVIISRKWVSIKHAKNNRGTVGLDRCEASSIFARLLLSRLFHPGWTFLMNCDAILFSYFNLPKSPAVHISQERVSYLPSWICLPRDHEKFSCPPFFFTRNYGGFSTFWGIFE